MALEPYNAERWAEGVKVGGACDVLNMIFGAEGDVAGWVRGVGMRVMGMEGVVGRAARGWVMRQAEG